MITENMRRTSLLDNIDHVLFEEDAIRSIVERLAKCIEEEYRELVEGGDKLVVLGLLNGSVQFMADLVRKIDLPLEMQFMFTSSYGTSTVSSGEIKIHMGKCEDILNDPSAHLLVIEDIIDSGNTLSKVLQILNGMDNKSVKLCALFDKPDRRVVNVDVDFVGAKIPDEFIVGYGLDYNEKYRNLPFVGVLKREVYEQ